MSASITVTLPLPRTLLPNQRLHWRERSRWVRDTRLGALVACITACAGGVPGDWRAARLDIEWRAAGPLPDDDNCVAAAKASRDGLAYALGIDDRHIRTGSVRVLRVPRSEEALVLTLTRCEEGT
jgi:hypothetical protein